MTQSATEPIETTLAEAADHEEEGRAKKRKKRKTSRGLRELQRLERRLSKAAHRSAHAVERGVAEYRRRRDRSAGKKRDGALWDMPRNSAEALATSLREASRVPVDLVRAVDTKTARRALRFGTRVLLLPFAR